MTPDGLICPASAIFDRAEVADALEHAFFDARDSKEIRAATVATLQAALKRGRSAIADAFRADPRNAWPAVRSYAYLTDCVVTCIFDVATTRLHRLSNPTESERITLGVNELYLANRGVWHGDSVFIGDDEYDECWILDVFSPPRDDLLAADTEPTVTRVDDSAAGEVAQ